MKTLGKHTIIEFYKCLKDILNDEFKLELIVKHAVNFSEARIDVPNLMHKPISEYNVGLIR